MATLGFKWGLPITGTSGGAVTWSFAVFPSIIWDYDAPIVGQQYQADIAAAFATWESVANINFVYDPGDPDANIVLGFNYIDGMDGTLAVTSWRPILSATPRYVEIEFDSSELWLTDPTFKSFGSFHNFYGVALHEIGHAIGLAHSASQLSIMYAFDVGNASIFLTDILDIQNLYGTRVIATTAGDINGDAEANVLTGSNGNDRIFAGAGSDLIHPEGGDDQVFGGDGVDYVFETGNRSSFLTGLNSNVATVVDVTLANSQGMDTLTDVERIVFNDGILALDIHGNAGEAYRLYQAAFDRTPDTGGLAFWIGQVDAGMGLIEMSARFIDSAEFRSLYGASPTQEQFIALVYDNVLHRAPDQGGHDYWAGQMASGMSEAEVVARFSDSTENQINVIGAIVDGIWLPNA